MDTHKIIVRYPCSETESQRKKREKLGEPLPHYAFTVSGNANDIPADDKRREERK